MSEEQSISHDLSWATIQRLRTAREKISKEPVDIAELSHVLQLAEMVIQGMLALYQPLHNAGWQAAVSYMEQFPRTKIEPAPTPVEEHHEMDPAHVEILPPEEHQ